MLACSSRCARVRESAVLSVFDPVELAERDSELRRDLDRFASDRDAKIKKIRSGP